MSLLNYTAATPGRVFALLRMVQHFGTNELLSKSEAVAWMSSDAVRTRDGKAKGRPKEGMDHTVSFATEIGLLEGGPVGPWKAHGTWNEINELADAVHSGLARLEVDNENAIILGAYAVLIMQAQKSLHFGWALQKQKHVASEINDVIMKWRNTRNENLLSDEKLGTWEDWVGCMGLLMPEAVHMPFAPYPLFRMKREIVQMGKDPGTRKKKAAKEFWKDLAARMPYLDDGTLWNSLRPIVDVPPFDGTLSFVSSVCLSRLAEEKLIDFDIVADAQSGIRLGTDNRTVSTITVRTGGRD